MKVLLRITALIAAAIIIIFVLTKDAGEKNGNDSKNADSDKISMIKADEDFAKAAAAEGTGKAFIDYADEDAVLLRQNEFPIEGIQALKEHYKGRDTVKTALIWKPVKAEVSPDGQLGYTFGNWEYTFTDKSGKRSTSYGNYVTIWKKQSDGSWKYVLDGGSDTPPPPDK